VSSLLLAHIDYRTVRVIYEGAKSSLTSLLGLGCTTSGCGEEAIVLREAVSHTQKKTSPRGFPEDALAGSLDSLEFDPKPRIHDVRLCWKHNVGTSLHRLIAEAIVEVEIGRRM
jgi:hypothetical protein